MPEIVTQDRTAAQRLSIFARQELYGRLSLRTPPPATLGRIALLIDHL